MPAWLQHDWCSSFVLALGHFLWQGTLIAVVLAIALRATKSVSARYWLALTALLAMSACPIVTLGWLMQPVGSGSGLQNSKLADQEFSPLQQPAPPILNFEDLTPASRDVGHVSNVPVIPPAPTVELNTDLSGRSPNLQPAADEQSWWQKFAPQLTTTYLCGVTLMLLRLVFGLWGGRRLRRRVHLIDDLSLLNAMQRQAAALGLKLLPVLAYCERVTVPTVVGVLQPMILLPLTLTSGLSPEQIESVLAHELAHLRRCDHLVNLLQRVIESLLFFHPAVWWVSHRVREEREHCCDDLVVACGAMPLDYAKSLLRVAELSRASKLRRSVAAVSLLATGDKPSSLRQRIARLLGESTTPSLRISPRVLLVTICVPILALIVTLQSGSSNQQSSPAEDAKSATTEGDNALSLTDAEFIAKRFSVALTKQKMPFLDESRIQALQTELRDDFAMSSKTPLSVARRDQLLAGIDGFVAEHFRREEGDHVYLEFRNEFETLKWQLRIAASHAPLTDAELARREQQRKWMANATETLPESPRFRITHKDELAKLDRLLSDPLNPFFAYPMSEPDFVRFQKAFDERVQRVGADKSLIYAASWVADEGIQAQIDSLLREWPVKNRGWQRHGTRWSLIVAPERVGNSSLELMDLNRNVQDVYADVLKNIFVAEDAPADLAKRDEWLLKQTNGDLSFDAKLDSLVGVRGAKLALLDAPNWYEADRVPLADLHRLIDTRGQASLPMSHFAEPQSPDEAPRRPKKPQPILVVRTGSGGLSVIRILNVDPVVIMPRPRPLAPNPPLHPGDQPRARRGAPDPALDPTAGLPNSDEETNQPNNANGDLRSNPAAESGDTRRAQYSAKLPNGVEVELAGVAFANAAGPDGSRRRKEEAWWRADGMKLAAPPFKLLSVLMDENATAFREFAIQLRSPRGESLITAHHLRWSPHPKPGIGGVGGWVTDARTLREQERSSKQPQAAVYQVQSSVGFDEEQPIAVHVIVSDQPLGPAWLIGLDGKPLSQSPADATATALRKLIQIVRIEDLQTGTTLRYKLSPDFEEWTEWEVRAIDKKGEGHLDFDGKGPDARAARTTNDGHGQLFQLPAADIRHFEIRLRPMTHKVTFENVSLVPGQMTDVKVKVEPIDLLALNGLEFLKAYPKLHGLSLDMTEPQFLEIVKQQELKTRKTVDGGKVTHHITLGDGHTLIVMFDKDGKCSGIQRARGDDDDRVNATEENSKPKRSPNPLVSVLQPAEANARLDPAGKAMPIGMVQRLGSTRFKVPGWWRRLGFAGKDEWVWLKADERVSVIHRETGRVVKHQQLRLGEGSVRTLTTSADGTRVAIGMFDPPYPSDFNKQTNYRVVVMSALTTAHLQEMKWTSLPADLNCISFSGDGGTLLTGDSRGDVRLWDVETGKQLRQQAFEEGAGLFDAAMSPDGRSVVLGGRRMSFFWKLADNAGPIKLANESGDSVSFAPNGRLFSTIGREGVRLWNAENGELIAHLKTKEFENYSDADFGHSFTSDSRLLAVPVSSYDVVELWDVETKQRVATLPVHHPRGVAISRDGRWLAASGNESFTAIFDLKTRQQVNQPGDGHSHEVLSVRFAGTNSLASSSDGDARVWDMKTGKQQQTLPHQDKTTTVRGLATSPDGTLIVTSAFDDTLGLWDRATGKRLFTLKGHGSRGGTRAARFKADGSQFVSWGDDAVLRWWNAKDGSLVAAHPLEVPGYVYQEAGRNPFDAFSLCAAFAPDTKSLFVVFDKTLSEFDTGTGKRLRQVPIPPRTKPLAVSADGRWLAAGETRRDEQGNVASTAIVLRDRATLKVVREWPVSDPRDAAANADPDRKPSVSYIAETDNGLAFSPDSRFLAWSRIDAHPGIDIVEVAHDRLHASIPVESPCWCLDFSPDGKQLAVGHANSTASVWDFKHATFSVAEVKGLEFLKPYPKLHGLSLDMTEPQFLEIVKQQELKTRKTVDDKRGKGQSVTYHIALGDGHTLIVTFYNAKCSGIQRVRGDDVGDKPAAVQKLGAPSIVLPDHLNVKAVGFDREGKELVSVATEHDVAVRVWDLVEKKLKREVKLETDKHANFFLQGHLTLSGDRQRVLAILEGKVLLWDAATGKLVKTLVLPEEMNYGLLSGLASTPDLSVVACGREPGLSGISPPDAHAIVWDVATGKVLRTVKHTNAVQLHSLALSPDGKLLATGGQQTGTCVWDISTETLLHQWPNNNGAPKHSPPDISDWGHYQILCLRFSPDGQRLALGDMLGVKMMDVKSGKLLFQCDAPFRYGRSGLVFSKDGQLLARIATDKVVPIWSAHAGKLLVEIPTEAHSGCFSDDGRSFAVGFSDAKQAVAIWQLQALPKQEQNTANGDSPSRPAADAKVSAPAATASKKVATGNDTEAGAGPRGDQDAVVLLPNGLKMELVAIAHANVNSADGAKRKAEGWWRPDGTKLVVSPVGVKPLTVTPTANHANFRELVFRVKPMDTELIPLVLKLGMLVQPWNTQALATDGWNTDGELQFQIAKSFWDDSPGQTSLYITDLPLVKAATVNLSGKLVPDPSVDVRTKLLLQQVRVTGIEKSATQTILKLKSHSRDERVQIEVTAVLLNGQTVRAIDTVDLERRVIPRPASEISSFEIRLRPMTYGVVFNRFAMLPGQKVKLEATVRPLEASVDFSYSLNGELLGMMGDVPTAELEKMLKQFQHDLNSETGAITIFTSNRTTYEETERLLTKLKANGWKWPRLGIRPRVIECDILDAATGKPVNGTTVNFRFLKPKSGDKPEEIVADVFWGPKAPSHLYFSIPDEIMARPDRQEIEVEWGVAQHDDYEPLTPKDRLKLKPFLAGDAKLAVETLSSITLTPKKKSAVGDDKQTSQIEKPTFWTPRRPDAVESKSKETAKILDDGSVQMSLPSPNSSNPQLEFQFKDETSIDSVRLEVLPDLRFADRRLGRIAGRELMLFEFKPHVLSADGKLRSLEWKECRSLQDAADDTVVHLIDYATDTGWKVPPLKAGQTAHELVFRMEEPLVLKPGDALLVDVDSGGSESLDTLARFRVSFPNRILPQARSGTGPGNEKADAAKQSVEIRLVGGPKAEPLPKVKVEFTTGYGSNRKSFGTFTTDKAGWLKASLPAEFYELDLKSEKEWPYLPFEKFWTGNRGGYTTPLSVFVTDKKADTGGSSRTRERSDRSLTTPAQGSSGRTLEVEKWLGGYRRASGFEPATNEHPARITFTLEPAVELVLRAVDIETGKGLAGAEFYEVVSGGEDPVHPVYGENLGSKFPYDSNFSYDSQAETEPAYLTDNDGYLRRWVGEKDISTKFGVRKGPTGYELVEPKAELSVLTELGQARVEQVFKFRRIRWAVRLEPEKKKVTLGEPLTLTFFVKNATNEPRGLELGGDYRNRLGRPESFEVRVINNEAKPMPVPDAGPTKGGLSSNVLLKPDGETKVELKLSDWATITQPGNYRVFVKRTLKLFPIKAQQGDRTEWGDQPEVATVAAACEFDVIAPAAAVIDANSEPNAEGKQSSPQPTTLPPVGLEFLKPYPKLHGLSLDMTEPQFLEIVKQHELKTTKIGEGEKVTHRIALGDDHTLIVMFDKDAKCSGIQRVRGEGEVKPAQPVTVIQLDPQPVVGDFSKVDDPDVLLDQLAKSQLPSLVPMTGGGFFQTPGAPPHALYVPIWDNQYAGNDKLDPRIRRLIELGDRAVPRVHQRLSGIVASDLLAAHLTLVLRSAGTTESVPVLIKLLKTTPNTVLDGTQSLDQELKGFQASVTQLAVTSALWKLTDRNHLFTPDQWEKWWQSVKPDFVIPRERQRPAFVARVTADRVKALANDLATNEVAARERLISLGPAAIPHLLKVLNVAESLRDSASPSDAAAIRLAWVIDELGATDKLSAKLRREYFERRMADAGTHVSSYPIDEDAFCRALSHCSFAEFCSICLVAPGRSDPAGPWGWMHMNPIVFSRRFGNQPRFVSGDPANFPLWNRVTPAAKPQQEIADAVPVLIAALNHRDANQREMATKLADIIGLCSNEKPLALIVALRDRWLSEPEANVRVEMGSAMSRFASPIVNEAVLKGLRSERLDILGDAAAFMDGASITLNNTTRTDFERLVELTRHENDRVRRCATRSLAYNAPQLLGPEFERLCTDKVKDIREACTLALRSNPDPKHAGILFKLADDAEQSIRESAFSSIANLNHPPSMKRLLPHLRDKKVHGYAVSALASMGGQDALPLMMSELESGNDVGGMVYQHLRRLTGERFEEKPEPWLAWWKKNKPAPATK